MPVKIPVKWVVAQDIPYDMLVFSDTVKWLVDNGGNTKVESNKGNTPLIVAKANARTTVVSFLKNCGKKSVHSFLVLSAN